MVPEKSRFSDRIRLKIWSLREGIIPWIRKNFIMLVNLFFYLTPPKSRGFSLFFLNPIRHPSKHPHFSLATPPHNAEIIKRSLSSWWWFLAVPAACRECVRDALCFNSQWEKTIKHCNFLYFYISLAQLQSCNMRIYWSLFGAEFSPRRYQPTVPVSFNDMFFPDNSVINKLSWECHTRGYKLS